MYNLFKRSASGKEMIGAVYRSICPHCGEATLWEESEAGVVFDTPRRLCPSCSRAYFDGQFHELALDYYNSEKELPPNWWRPLLAIVMDAVLAVFVLTDKSLFPDRKIWILILAVFLWALASSAKGIYQIVFKKKVQTAYEKEKAELLADPSRQSADLSESLTRMSDEDYLYYLIENEIGVPDYFFRCIGHERDPQRVAEKE